MNFSPPKEEILGVGITNAPQRTILEYVLASLDQTGDPYYIVTPNPEMIVRAVKDGAFRSILNQARISLCDGIGLWYASHILGQGISQRTTGVDLLVELCKESVKKPITVGFLGGGPGVAQRTAECLMRRFPGLQVVYIAEEWGEDGFDVSDNIRRTQKDEDNSEKRTKHIDILFVAFGAPKQEQFMHDHIAKIQVRVMMGVGGAFDYISGEVSRAPFILRYLGLEWLYRLIRQPWRWRRQLALPVFVWLVLKERFSRHTPSHAAE